MFPLCAPPREPINQRRCAWEEAAEQCGAPTSEKTLLCCVSRPVHSHKLFVAVQNPKKEKEKKKNLLGGNSLLQ